MRNMKIDYVFLSELYNYDGDADQLVGASAAEVDEQLFECGMDPTEAGLAALKMLGELRRSLLNAEFQMELPFRWEEADTTCSSSHLGLDTGEVLEEDSDDFDESVPTLPL